MSRPARLLEMVHMLAGRRPRSLGEIVSRFEISERTAYRDLAELGSRVPLVRDEHGYKLLESATLKPLNLTSEEHALLRVALANPALTRLPDLRRHLDALASKLDAATKHVEESPVALQLAGPAKSGPTAEREFATLQEATRERTTVEIEYVSLSGGTTRWRRVDPYRLFERNHVWYLAGHSHEHGEVRIFRLDRVKATRTIGQRFSVPRDFRLDRFLEEAWSAFRGPEEVEVELLASKRVAPLFLLGRHHDGEEAEELASGEVRYRVRIRGLEEIARWIVGFGGEVRAVAPRELRNLVRTIAEGAARAQGDG